MAEKRKVKSKQNGRSAQLGKQLKNLLQGERRHKADGSSVNSHWSSHISFFLPPASCSTDMSVKIWSMESFTCVKTLKGAKKDEGSMRMSSSNVRLSVWVSGCLSVSVCTSTRSFVALAGLH